MGKQGNRNTQEEKSKENKVKEHTSNYNWRQFKGANSRQRGNNCSNAQEVSPRKGGEYAEREREREMRVSVLCVGKKKRRLESTKHQTYIERVFS